MTPFWAFFFFFKHFCHYLMEAKKKKKILGNKLKPPFSEGCDVFHLIGHLRPVGSGGVWTHLIFFQWPVLSFSSKPQFQHPD